MKSIFQRAIDAWGRIDQINKTTEECAELIVSLRHDTCIDHKDHNNSMPVITEMADVAIMLEQMKLIYGEEKFQAEYKRKLDRLEAKLNTR